MKKTIITTIIVVAAVLAAAIYFTFDPADTGNLFPKCIFVTLTGYQCPGCGTQRAIHCFLHGDIAGMWHYNAALFVAIPTILLYLYAGLRRNSHMRLYNALNSTTAIVIILVVIISWWILRNIFCPL